MNGSPNDVGAAAPRWPEPSPLVPSVVLETCMRLVFHATAATSLFFLFAGHNAPGGGFIGGLVAGTAFVLRYLVGGAAVGPLRVRPPTVLGVGLLVAAGTAVAPWLTGGQVLESAYLPVDVPVVGTVSLTSVLVFDTGVYLIVVGIVLTLLTTLGTRPEASLGDAEDLTEEDRA